MQLKINKLLLGCGIFNVVWGATVGIIGGIKGWVSVLLTAFMMVVLGSIAIPLSFKEEDGTSYY